MKIAIYDLDKTLTVYATYTPFLIFAARKAAAWRLLLLPIWIAAMIGYKLGLTKRDALKAFGMRLMVADMPADQLDILAQDFAQHHINGSGFLPGALRLLEEDRAAGAKIIMATAAFDFYARYFAVALDIETVIGSGWDGERISGGNCYGARKKERVLSWFEEQGFEREHVYIRFVSDSFADAPLLDYSDEAIFNTASASAKTRAEERGWQVLDLRH